MNKRKHKFCVSLLGGILAVSILGGCGNIEQTKTIVLPPLDDQETDSEKLSISRIREYMGSGREEDRMCLAWGEPGSDLIYQMKIEDGRYVYQIIDIREDSVVKSIRVDDRAADISNVSIAPGGQYVSYEVRGESGMELIVFFLGPEVCQTLHSWKDPEETFSYIWSDDGTKLFSWQNGDNRNSHADWSVTRYDMKNVSAGGWRSGSFQGGRMEFLMKGRGRSWRILLPNADGSEIYVREQFRPFNDTLADEREDESDGGMDASNWLLLQDGLVREELPEYSKASVYPVRYTAAGLFIQEADGTLCLVEDIRSDPVKKELLAANSKHFPVNPYICENGDHVFLMEWINYSMYQISGVRIVDGEADGVPVILYQDKYDRLVQMTVQRDQAVMFWGKGTLDNDQYHYKATLLEY